MKPVICVRRYEEGADRYVVQEVVKEFVMARFSSAFWFCLFREVIDEDFRSFTNLTLIVVSTKDHSTAHCSLDGDIFHLLRASAAVLPNIRAYCHNSHRA